MDGWAGGGAGPRGAVAELAARAGLRPPRVRIAPTRSVAHVRATRAGAVLVLDPTLLDADRRVLRAAAAHELGHLAARHDRDVKARLWAMVGGAAASGGVVLAATSDLIAAATAVLVVAGLATLHVLRRLRGHELAADRCAVRLLGEADSMRTALAWLEERHPRAPRRWARFLADHPGRQERIAALRDL